jgi:hypothetical protein
MYFTSLFDYIHMIGIINMVALFIIYHCLFTYIRSRLNLAVKGKLSVPCI